MFDLSAAESDDTDDDPMASGDTKDGIKREPADASATTIKQEAGVTSAALSSSSTLSSAGKEAGSVKTEKELKEAAQRVRELKLAETELVRDLKAQLK